MPGGETIVQETGGAAAPAKLEVTASRQLTAWMVEKGVSLAFTTYEAGKLFLIGLKPDGRLSIFERTFNRCMGLVAAGNSLWMSSLYQLWRFENTLEGGRTQDGYDRLYVPRVGYTTGDLDVHDIAVDGSGRPAFVNTLFSCLATVSEEASFVPLWKPAFVSKLAAEDRCHLNGLAVEAGAPRYVTAVAKSDVADGWREHRRDGGIVIDVASGEVVAGGLSMPHSPRLYRDRLWLHDSGTGRFGYVDRKAGRFEEVAFCPGYLRGLAFAGDFALVGLSKLRPENRTFQNLPLADALAAKGTGTHCGIEVIDLRSGDAVHRVRIEGVVSELYDVAALPGARRPMAVGFKTDEIRRLITIGEGSLAATPIRAMAEAASALASSVRRTAWLGLLWTGAISLGVNLLMLALPLYMLQIFDRVLTSRSIETLILLTLIAAFALICQSLLDHARRVALTRLASWLEAKLGGYLVGASLLRSLRTGQPSGEGMRDLAVVKNYVAGAGLLPLLDVPWTPVFVAVIFLLSPLLAAVAVAAMVLLLGLATLSEVLGRSGLQQAREIEARASQELGLALQNADTVQAMGMMPALVERWNAASGEAVTSHERADRRINFVASIAKMFRFAFQAAIFGVGAVLVLRGEFTPGAMIAVSILTGRALAPIDGAVGAWRSGIQARDSWRRIRQVLGDAPQPKPTLPLARPAGDLEATEVSYFYPGQREPALRNVSFRLPQGQSLAIVGPAASGKTTLARLIVGNLAPAYGHVRLDGIEVSRWAPEDKGLHVGYLAQDVELFPATVRENIARLADTPEGVVEAAQLIGAEEVIARLPQQYQTPVGPRGTALSGGQRQWLGLARAVWGNPCLVVLDEPNSNLDQEGEAGLIAGLDRLREKGTTVVLVTHRPAMLQQVDQVLVLRAGTVQAFGPRGTIVPRLIAPAAKVPSAGA